MDLPSKWFPIFNNLIQCSILEMLRSISDSGFQLRLSTVLLLLQAKKLALKNWTWNLTPVSSFVDLFVRLVFLNLWRGCFFNFFLALAKSLVLWCVGSFFYNRAPYLFVFIFVMSFLYFLLLEVSVLAGWYVDLNFWRKHSRFKVLCCWRNLSGVPFNLS